LAAHAPRLANRLTSLPGLRKIALFAAGVDARRSIPAFADETFRHWFTRTAPERSSTGTPVLLFIDSFTDHFSPDVGRAAVDLLETAGYTPEITNTPTCCGLTWITTGQLGAARRILGDTVQQLTAAVERGLPIVGLEPSCTGVLRSDVDELLNTDDARRVSAATMTLAELLTSNPNWTPPDLHEVRVVAQPHCHHHAVMGWDTDAKLLAEAGANVTRLGGCCGLAGNFGVERGHYDVSVDVAAQHLSPALAAAPDDLFLADGFSCRTQAVDLAGVAGVHLAQLLNRTHPPR
jgi:Fe-S oxidoreductase